MNSRQKIVTIIVLIVVCISGWFGFNLYRTLRQIPVAYAAWDTGTLLVEYMKQHDERWPKSWDELLTVLESADGQKLTLRGAMAGDVVYAQSLREKIAIDWHFNPANPSAANPITTADGQTFRMAWQGGEPNEMVRAHLSQAASTQAANE